jgi:hypothetical protein
LPSSSGWSTSISGRRPAERRPRPNPESQAASLDATQLRRSPQLSVPVTAVPVTRPPGIVAPTSLRSHVRRPTRRNVDRTPTPRRSTAPLGSYPKV